MITVGAFQNHLQLYSAYFNGYKKIAFRYFILPFGNVMWKKLASSQLRMLKEDWLVVLIVGMHGIQHISMMFYPFSYCFNQDLYITSS